MHPDEAVDLALQDLHISLGFRPVAPSAPQTPWLARMAGRLLRAWMDGWTWYARQGFAPAAAEPAFPLRAPSTPRRAVRRSALRWTTPQPPRPVSLLYDCATGAGCA
ncbi:MAG TPA: hypothetical protein VFJ82_10235 [Longimicrobium sp.]|nr:hypothetical protein [Longimicrobium sp.]